MKISNAFCPTFDDLLLLPQKSYVKSRSHVDTTMDLGFTKLKTPLIASNMSSVTGLQMARKMSELGGMAILHRYKSPEETLVEIMELDGAIAAPSVGVLEKDKKIAETFINTNKISAIAIDVAHGHCEAMVQMIDFIKKNFNIKIIAGNVATFEGALELAQAGADVIRANIGSGAACSTRITTGHGAPAAWSIMEAVRIKQWYPNVKILADGGIRNAGDAVKAFALGADGLILGSMFAGTDEAPGQVVMQNGKTYKEYAGMASAEARKRFDPNLTSNYTPEGVSALVRTKGPVENVVNQIMGGVRSGCSYSGVSKLSELHSVAEFIKVTTAGQIEGTPHILGAAIK